MKGKVLTIEGRSLRTTITNKGPVLKVELDHDEEELYNFKTMATSEKDKAPFNFDPL